MTGSDVELRSLAGSSGVGWTTLQAEAGEDEFSAANALTVLRVTDPAWAGGGDTQPVEPIDDQLLEWFAAQPGLTAGPITEITPAGGDGAPITGRRLDYVIGDLTGIGSDCSSTDPTKGLCASLLVFGPFLRGFASGEQGTLYDLDLGGTRLVALGIGTGNDIVASLHVTSRDLPADSIGTVLVGDGQLQTDLTYRVPDLVDGFDVITGTSTDGLSATLEPGLFRITSPDQPQPVLAVFRGDLASWIPDSTYDPVIPVPTNRTVYPPTVDIDAVALAEQLPASVTIVEAPTPVDIEGHPAVQFVLRHDGPGLDSCRTPCVAPLIQSTGRVAYLYDGVPRRFTIIDVDGQTLVVVTTGGAGEEVLAGLRVEASAPN